MSERNRALAAVGSAIRSDQAMPPSARLWLARASLFADAKGRTNYGPARYADWSGDTVGNAQRGIDWLLANGLVSHDHTDDGAECWRLGHFDWQADPVIAGYGRDTGQRRDGLPPQYGRTVKDVIEPPTGRQDFEAPSWDAIRADVMSGE